MSAIDRRQLAEALNAIEAGAEDEAEHVEAAWAAPRGRVIGITGPPGVGKSTLAGRLVGAWRAEGLSVGALCIDPSSRRSGGALLGDRLRMRLAGDDPDVFVRSLAARGRLGGLAPKAFEAVTVMRAAVDRVLVETVGVGQSEVEVAGLADVTVVVIQPGSGDALQFLKAGLMEVFDVLVVNKADLGELAESAARELRSALRAMGRREVPVLSVSAEQASGIAALLAVIEGLAAPGEQAAQRREAAMREVMLERFVAWHGDKTVKRLGGLEAVRDRIGATASSPGAIRAALEALVEPLPAARSKPWIGEVEVDQASARALVAGVAPELAEVTPEPLGAGWDNTAWLFRAPAGSWVFRFPRRALAVPLLERELALLPRIAGALPLPVTEPCWQGQMPNGWPFGGYRFIDGHMAAISGLSSEDKIQPARAWGAFLRALHELDPATLDLPVDPLGKVDVLRRWDVTLSSLATTGSRSDAIVAVLEQARRMYPTMGVRPRVVCHGDFDGRHVLVARRDDGWQATGVIDWGDLMIGDPACDLGLAYSLLEGASRQAFFGAYGPIDPASEALARFRAIASQVWVLSWALDIGHAEHAAEARQALVRATG